jgi:hypothetical protein
VLGPNARWTLQRIALLDSPLLMIAAVASLFTDRPLLGIALALASFGFFMLGRPTLGRRYPPAEEERRGQAPLATPTKRGERPKRERRTKRRDFKGF